MELSETYVRSAEAIEALRRVSQRLSEGNILTYPAQREAIAPRVKVSEDVINDFATGKAKRTNFPELHPALWELFWREHRSLLESTHRAVLVEKLIDADPVTNALHHFFQPGTPLDKKQLAELEGHYKAFAPFFLNEREVIVMALECGAGGNPTAFTLIMQYEDMARRNKTDRIEGTIIPCGKNVLFIGQIMGQQTPYLFTLYGFPVSDGKVEGSEGVTLVGSRGPRASASAYPIVILRSDTPAECRVIPTESAAAEIPEWDAVAPVFERGIVRWQ